MPFSDPLADGPVIQRAGARALAAGTSLVRVLETVAELRRDVSVPLVLMTYYNPILAFGLQAFAETAAKAGLDGVLVPDLPIEEADPLRAETDAAGVDLAQFVAPTTTVARLRRIARQSRGFIYLVSLTGVTGERTRAAAPSWPVRSGPSAASRPSPCASASASARRSRSAMVGDLADGVIVGSAIVRCVEEHAGSPSLVSEVGEFIAALKAPLRAARS